ncbi:hypothetical protein FN846DRAFT_63065 [Sphaerosporella brunnea]|uniref:Uncharacterized protein n=1 Tax=Sphaerosporella brunnea TaxID=1250544 RepID=A0A5J5EV40_9PEZI|nr:hypothetical protein FN846DRAFT_63065 [Sphaerosporella brunnea]
MSSFQLRMQETGYNFLVPSIPFYSYAPALESHCFILAATPPQMCKFFFFFFFLVTFRPAQANNRSPVFCVKKKKKKKLILWIHSWSIIQPESTGSSTSLDCDLRMPESNCPWAPRSTVGCVPASQLHGCSQVRCEGSIIIARRKKKKKRSCSSFPMAPIQKLPTGRKCSAACLLCV